MQRRREVMQGPYDKVCEVGEEVDDVSAGLEIDERPGRGYRSFLSASSLLGQDDARCDVTRLVAGREEAGTGTVHSMPPSDADADEEPVDRREVLVAVLRDAIPSGFRKEGLGRHVEIGKRWRPAKGAPESGAGKERTPKDDALSTRTVLRRLERAKAKDADQRIAEWKAEGTRWWASPVEEKSPLGWLDMPSSEITDEIKQDLDVLSMRGAFNPKKHYRNLERLEGASWIQIGTVMDHPLDGRKGRLPNRLRKRTLTQQWMADPEMGGELQKKFARHQDEQDAVEHLRSKQYPLMSRRHRKKRQAFSS